MSSNRKEERPPKPTVEKLTKNQKKKLRRESTTAHASSCEESQPAVKKKASAAIDEPIAKRHKNKHDRSIPSTVESGVEDAKSEGGMAMEEEVDTRRVSKKRASAKSDQAGKREWLASLLDGSNAGDNDDESSNAKSRKSKRENASPSSKNRKGGRYEWPEELIATPLPSLLEGEEAGGTGSRAQHFLVRRQERKAEKKAEFAERQERRESAKREKSNQRQQEPEWNDTEPSNGLQQSLTTMKASKNRTTSENKNEHPKETEQQRQARLLWEGNAPSRQEHTQFQKRREPFRKKDPVTRSFEQKQKRNSFKSLM